MMTMVTFLSDDSPTPGSTMSSLMYSLMTSTTASLTRTVHTVPSSLVLHLISSRVSAQRRTSAVRDGMTSSTLTNPSSTPWQSQSSPSRRSVPCRKRSDAASQKSE